MGCYIQFQMRSLLLWSSFNIDKLDLKKENVIREINVRKST